MTTSTLPTSDPECPVNLILHHAWDPLGVTEWLYDPRRKSLVVLDEYSDYAWNIQLMLDEGADEQAVAEFLLNVQAQFMDLPYREEEPMPVDRARGAARLIWAWWTWDLQTAKSGVG